MELITKEIEKKIPPLHSTEETPLAEKEIVVKYFDSMGSWTWYVVEGEKEENGDWLFWGLVDGHEREYGYFSLSQLQQVNERYPRIERDLYFENKTIGDVI